MYAFIEGGGQFDLLTSNGLNIYVPDHEQEVALYRSFAGTLKPGGFLVTSFLTPPPGSGQPSPWRDINMLVLMRQKLIFGDVIGVKWRNFRSEDQMRELLKSAWLETAMTVFKGRQPA